MIVCTSAELIAPSIESRDSIISATARKLDDARVRIITILSNCSWLTRKIAVRCFSAKGRGQFEPVETLFGTLAKLPSLRSVDRRHRLHPPMLRAAATNVNGLGVASVETAPTLHTTTASEVARTFQSRLRAASGRNAISRSESLSF